MAKIPTNRRSQMIAAARRTAGNVQMVGNALRMNIPAPRPEALNVDPEARRRAEVELRRAESAMQLGGFIGAVSGVFVGVVLGLALGAAAGPIAALALIIALALGGAALGFMALGSDCLPALIGACLLGGAGAWIGMFLGAYVLLICPIIGAAFCAYHGGVQGTLLGQRWATQRGTLYASTTLSGLAGVCIGGVWLFFVTLSHHISAEASVIFLALITSSCITAGSVFTLAYLLAKSYFREKESSNYIATTIAVTCISVFLYLALPSKHIWSEISIPKSWLKNWMEKPKAFTNTLQSTSATGLMRELAIDSNVRSGPAKSYSVIAVQHKGSQLEVLEPNSTEQWVKVRLADGRIGYINKKLFVPVTTNTINYGHWEGMWQSKRDHYWFQFELVVRGPDNNLSGQISWYLKDAPRGSKLRNKIGASAIEYVKGSYDPQSQILRLKGTQITDPKLIIKDEYRLRVSSNLRSIEGKSKTHRGNWSGFMSGS